MKWRSRRIWRRVRKRRVHAELRKTPWVEKHFREQAEPWEPSNAAREISTAFIEPSKRYLKGVAGEIPVGAEKPAGTLPEIGNDHNVGLVISRAGFDPCLPLAHVVGRSQVCVSDRKSTRLNSSHSQISYAVFCLKKKKPSSPMRCPYKLRNQHRNCPPLCHHAQSLIDYQISVSPTRSGYQNLVARLAQCEVTSFS